ncbi:hypothetical protein BD779DRAFT_1450461 [Infundibulicybe gibba]|nr:hypothetical protein BD779DRAFT_1450461 [Infundibulicybe gibba]
MVKIAVTPAAALLAFIPVVLSQSGMYSQCGGFEWLGPTTCVAGADCVVLNEWFSQCVPSASTTTTTNSSPTTPAGPVTTGKGNYWFSFGDSYTQTGFTPSSTLPAPGNPLGNPPYPGWTSSNGENWVDFVATAYNKSLLLTYNYAYGGATIDAKLVTPFDPSVLSLTDQVNQFLNSVASKPASTPWTSANSLFSIWIGINDIGNSYYLSGDRSAFSDTLLNAEFALVQKLSANVFSPSNVGARNFLFLNVPPVDRSPLMLAQAASAQAIEKTVIDTFNSKLAAKASAFKSANSGVQTWIWDSNAAFKTILNSPKTYGFTDATSYGATGNFWLNNLHPTSPAHKIFGQQVGSLLGSTIW